MQVTKKDEEMAFLKKIVKQEKLAIEYTGNECYVEWSCEWKMWFADKHHTVVASQ